MIVRPTARVIALDPTGRVLLFRCENDAVPDPHDPRRIFWITPGGGVEAGETFEDAARRELLEETGIAVAAVGPCLLEREDLGQDTDFGDHGILYRGRHFLVRLSAAEVACLSPDAMAQSGYRIHRWWPLDALARCTEAVWPNELPILVRHALAQLKGSR